MFLSKNKFIKNVFFKNKHELFFSLTHLKFISLVCNYLQIRNFNGISKYFLKLNFNLEKIKCCNRCQILKIFLKHKGTLNKQLSRFKIKKYLNEFFFSERFAYNSIFNRICNLSFESSVAQGITF